MLSNGLLDVYPSCYIGKKQYVWGAEVYQMQKATVPKPEL